MKTTNELNKVPMLTKIFFGAGDMYGGGAFNIVNFFYAIFLTDVVQLSPAMAAPIFLIGKIWDAVTDPLMGILSDRTNTKFGRRRPYFLSGVILIFLSFVILWYPANFENTTFKFIYVLFSYVFFNTVFTIVMVPYSAMAAEITLDYNERTSVNSIRLMFSLGASVLCAILPMQIVNSASDPRTGYIYMAVFFGILFSLPWIGVFTFTKEKPQFKALKKEFDWKKTFLEPIKIKSFRTLLVFFLASYLAMDVVSMIFAYYMTYYMNAKGSLPLVLGSLIIVQICFVPVYAHIAKKKSKNFAYILGTSIWILISLLTLIIRPTWPIWTMYLFAALIGSGISAASVMPHAIFGDVTDVGELYFNERREGSFSGLITFTRKFSSAIVQSVVLTILGVVGYLNPIDSVEFQQPENVINTIRYILAFAPLIILSFGLIAAFRYPLTHELHNKLRDHLAYLRGDKKVEPLTEEEIKILKDKLI